MSPYIRTIVIAYASAAVMLASAGARWMALADVPAAKPIVVAQAPTPPKKPPEKAAPAATPAAPQTAAAPQGLAVPQPEVLLLMLRTALISLDQANKTNNYSVMHALGGPLLQQQSPERLAELFTGIRNTRADLQVVALLTPQLTETPVITPQGLLTLTGLFPSQPLQIRFQVAFQPVAGYWRVAGIGLNLVPNEPQATAQNAPAQPAQQPAPAAAPKAAAEKKKP